jgi:general secretion pathway protein E
MVEPLFNQMQVQQKIDLSFADGIKTLLRQDPDIIMIGEIRDSETAEMATQAALTGHLVLSTLHTNDAPSAITRLLDLHVASYLINSTVLGVMAQRLVRTLCPHCKAEADIDQATWDTLVAPWPVPKPAMIYKAVGCLECRMTGYRGRSGIYEMFTISPAIKKLITSGADLGSIKAVAHQEGMQPLMINGAEKVAAGTTTIEELIKVAPSPLD